MGLSTHILDTNLGRPVEGITIALEALHESAWQPLGRAQTDVDGRCKTLLGDQPLEAKTYRLTFATQPYFEAQGLRTLYPFVEITFRVHDAQTHHHIPLLLSANGYSTYRGS
jgi:5-hydroxyisourate hydrolase